MTERWLPVVGFEGLYEVSDMGRIRSLDRIVTDSMGRTRLHQGQLLTISFYKGQHGRIILKDGNRRKNALIHVEVLRAFVGEPEPGQECRHLDDVKTNNRLENLLWGTPSENMWDRVRNGLHYQASKTECLHGHPFDDENTRTIRGQRRRICKACSVIRGREYRARKAAA